MILEIKNLVKRYGEFLAIDNLNLKVEEGEILGLLGPNGAGKTTTINTMLGLLNYDSGQIIRLMVKDDGVGATNIKEGLAIKGMRERVENMGGSFSIDFSNGTTMVTILKVRD